MIILFGARARGDFKRTSDIDLAVSGRGFLQICAGCR
ncbi:nucleotidyltransferase domain-containing protein [Blautia glucerasea]|nr:nucleotidyltransferase domain-containing protein [Blautia glucerasea]